MIVSPFTPLFFSPSTDKYGAKSKYVQKFAPSDHIFVEVITDYGEVIPKMFIHNLVNEKKTPVVFSSWRMNREKTVYFYIISGLPSSYYKININELSSETFKITNDNSELAETTLIQYSMEDNRQRLDSVFWIDGMQYFMDFRVPGGFKDAGWTFGVDNEQFVTADEDVVELYSHEYTLQTFTLGNAMGCPVWFAELFNRILCCTYIYFDGVRYARKEGNVPELNQQIEGLKSFIFNQILQKVKTMNPALEWNNQVSMRRIYGDTYRKTNEMRSIKIGGEKVHNNVPAIVDYINMSAGEINTEYFNAELTDRELKITNIINYMRPATAIIYDVWSISDSKIENEFKEREQYKGKLFVSGVDNFIQKYAPNSIFGFSQKEIVNGYYEVLILKDGVYDIECYKSIFNGVKIYFRHQDSFELNNLDLEEPIKFRLVSEANYNINI